MTDLEPPSTSPTWEARVPSSAFVRPKPSKKLWAARILGLLAVASFSLFGAVWIDQSMDVPWSGPTGNERFGFYGNRLPSYWMCGDGHHHYSAPFWSGALLFAIPTALWWFLWPRRRG